LHKFHFPLSRTADFSNVDSLNQAGSTLCTRPIFASCGFL